MGRLGCAFMTWSWTWNLSSLQTLPLVPEPCDRALARSEGKAPEVLPTQVWAWPRSPRELCQIPPRALRQRIGSAQPPIALTRLGACICKHDIRCHTGLCLQTTPHRDDGSTVMYVAERLGKWQGQATKQGAITIHQHRQSKAKLPARAKPHSATLASPEYPP